MDRKLWGVFTGWQLTILGCVALIAPGALYAAVTFTAVTVVDPNTGAKSLVDNGRRLYVYDPIAGYHNLPSNYVNIEFSTGGVSGNSNCAQVYTIPSGKALVVTSINGNLINAGSSSLEDLYLDSSADCPSPDIVGTNLDSTGNTPFAIDLGLGATVPFGLSLYVYTFNASATGFIRGYLVPAGAVPAANTAEAAELHSPQVYDKATFVKSR